MLAWERWLSAELAAGAPRAALWTRALGRLEAGELEAAARSLARFGVPVDLLERPYPPLGARALFGAEGEAITTTAVRLRRADGTVEELPADRVYALTGYHPDFALFDRLGIVSDPVTGKPTLDPETMETVPGLYLAGSAGAGRAIRQARVLLAGVIRRLAAAAEAIAEEPPK